MILTAIYYPFVTIVFVCVWYFSLYVWYLVPFFDVLCYVNLRLYVPQFVVCWRFGAAGFEWCSFCRLKHNCSVHVVCGGWGLMAV